MIGNLQSLEIAPNQCQVSGVLTQDAVLDADRTWFLEGALQIGSPEISATLDIDAGTQIRGDNIDVTDYVLVYPGSSISANGNRETPVQFLSDDDNIDGSGEWGGVFLRGFDGLSVEGLQGSNLLENEFGILFADTTDQIRMGNVLIANFRNGCYAAESGADLSQIDTTFPGPTHLDGVHCANEAGANPVFGVVSEGSVGFPNGTVAPNNSNGDGLVYYNGAGGPSPGANTPFDSASGGLNFTGELVDRASNCSIGNRCTKTGLGGWLG